METNLHVVTVPIPLNTEVLFRGFIHGEFNQQR